MTKKSPLVVVFVLMALAGASRANAILWCGDCADFCCSQRCVTDEGFSTCGVSGPSCVSCRNVPGEETLLAQILAPAIPSDAPAAPEASRCSVSE